MNPPAAPAEFAGPPRRLEPAKLGIILFIVAECMFFAGLISAFIVFKFGSVSWPPAGQPRLPWEITAFNTALLILSAPAFHMAFSALRSGFQSSFRRWLGGVAVLGALFLAIQGLEWVRLLRFGLTAGSSVFGGFFYALVGLHGLHVAGGLVALFWVLGRALRGRYSAENSLGVDLCRTYWYFVVGLWPVLFVLVYL